MHRHPCVPTSAALRWAAVLVLLPLAAGCGGGGGSSPAGSDRDTDLIESPDTADDAPETTDAEPDTADDAPEATDVEPDTADDAPEATDVEPDTADDAPEATDVEPDTADDAPEATDAEPDTADDEPEAVDGDTDPETVNGDDDHETVDGDMDPDAVDGDDDGGADTETTETDEPEGDGIGSVVVGEGGGAIETAEVRLEIPAGAVAEGTRITVALSSREPPAGLRDPSPVLSFGPEGLVFSRPLRVCFPLPATVAGEEALVFWTAEGGGAFEVLAGCAVDGQGGLCCPVFHFSEGVAGGAERCGINQARCNDGTCAPGAACGTSCVVGQRYCAGRCVGVLSSATDCGACGRVCDTAAGQVCQSGVCRCGGSWPYTCADGGCAQDRYGCLYRETCTADRPYRCPDGYCAARREDCRGTCPDFLPEFCSVGGCAESADDCAWRQCPEGLGFRCYEGTCTNEGDALRRCPTPATCPPEAPTRCGPGGTCVSYNIQACPYINPCPTDRPVLCSQSGLCATDWDSCPPCPEGRPVLCPDGWTCVAVGREADCAP